MDEKTEITFMQTRLIRLASEEWHEKITTTLQTYSHLYPDKNRELADKLEEFVSEKYNAKEMYNARKT